MEIAFVVLHYGAMKDTVECIQSIREKVDTDKYVIIVVDNASPDKSYHELAEMYGNDNDIRLIQNEKNLGFAKGNNVGIRVARDEFNAKFVVVTNNDILLVQKNILSTIKKCYQDTDFSVMGPLILTKDGSYLSNPKGAHIMSQEEAERAIKRAKRILFFNKLGMASFYLLLERIKNSLRGTKNNQNISKTYWSLQRNRILHGCFLIFSPRYFEYFEGFDERTFLYMEEEILYKHLMDKKLMTLYSPELVVFHKEDASTDAIVKLKRQKIDFVNRNNIESLNAYIELLNEE